MKTRAERVFYPDPIKVENTDFFIDLDEPVPSCKLYKLIWSKANNCWKYRYHINCDYDIKKVNKNNPLYVYGHISDLKLRHNVNKTSINLEITSKKDFIELLKFQREADNQWRSKWIEEHPDYYDQVEVITFQNKSKFFYDQKNVIAVLKQNKDKTIFIVTPGN